MKRTDPRAIATNAAGIADAFRNCQIADHDGSARWDDLNEHFGGWIGLVNQIVLAGTAMEQHRVQIDSSAKWGCELPYIYEVWDEIADLLWNELPVNNLSRLVARAVTQAERLEEC